MMYVIGIMTAAGLILSFMVNRWLGKLLRAAEHPAAGKDPLVKTLVGKFTASYRLKAGVNNVDSFVDKYVYNYKIGGLYLSTWDKLCGQLPGILLFSVGVIMVASYTQDGGQVPELSTVWMALGAAGLLITCGFFQQRGEKLRAISRELKDYLANSLQGKLEREYMVPEEKYSQREQAMLAEWNLSVPKALTEPRERTMKAKHLGEPREQPVAVNAPAAPRQPETIRSGSDWPELAAAVDSGAIPDEEQKIIEEILQEFLL